MNQPTGDLSAQLAPAATAPEQKIMPLPPRPAKAWLVPGFLWLLIVLSLLVRLYNIHSPLLEYNHSRQTDTAFPVYYFLHEGIDLMHPKVPGFGPPWYFPNECPIFQATATILIRMTGMDIDAGCRLTNIIYFYLSALMLYLLARRFFEQRSTAVWILLFYLWSPFSIVWSRTCMDEFCVAWFTLAYVYFASLWLQRRRNPAFLVLAIGFGCLGALVKIISIMPVVPLLLCLPAAAIWDDMRRIEPTLKITAWKQFMRALAAQWTTVLLSLVLYIVPFAVGAAWINYADRFKEASPWIRYLTLTNLRWWYYGTLAQRLSPDWWRALCYRIGMFVIPIAAMGLPVIALIVVRKAPGFARIALYAAFIGTIPPVLIYFNQYYQHDYYMCAIFPMIALVTGYGLDYVVRHWVLTDWRSAGLIIGAILISWFIAYDYVSPSFTIGYDNLVCQVGKAIDEMTGPDDCVVVADWMGSPSILYYAKRSGYDVDEPQHGKPDIRSLTFLHDRNFTLLVCQQDHPWFNIWPHLTLLERVGPFAIIRIKQN